jgi:cytochrome c oxidase assembly factor CtaG/cytochrome c2
MHRNLRRLTLTAALIAGAPGIAVAHNGRTFQPHDFWTGWTFEPLVLVAVVVSTTLYLIGVRRLWSRQTGAGIRHSEVAAFATGLAAAAFALFSPLHSLGGVLFSAHMMQHELLISMSAPFIVLGRPLIPMLWALPPDWRRFVGSWSRSSAVGRMWHTLALPLVAFSLHAMALWAWHLPGPYQATLGSEFIHSLQHASFFGTALLFWWTILKTRGSELGYGVAVFYLFATALQTGALGALLTFANGLWYPAYATTTGPWGLSPLEDQQLGGLIMWIPGSIPYLVAGLFIFARWLRVSELRAARRESAAFVARVLTSIIAVISLLSCDRASGNSGYQLANADAERGRTAIRRYGCGSCHDIPGVGGAAGMVGPPLGRIAQRVYIAGVLPNDADNMIRWLENPPGVDPKTAMPYMGVTPRDARDITAYLYTLR